MMFKTHIKEQLGIEITATQEMQFEKYFELLIAYNQKINLTTIVEKEEVYYKHFFDSLTVLKVLKGNEHLCDIGSGAGFPSIPLKIMMPNLKVTIVDALNKRILFLETLIQSLQLKDVKAIHSRIETYALAHPKQFDVVTARALGKLNLILELGVPLLKIQGIFVAMKSQEVLEELKEATSAMAALSVVMQETIDLTLPLGYGKRKLLCFKKQKHVPQYPRKYAVMLKKPL